VPLRFAVMSPVALPPGAVPPSPGSACELIVVRHGETEWNKELRVQGRTDTALNDKGRLQAEKCAEALAARFASGAAASLPEIWSSELSRASCTASAIAAALGRDPGDVRRDARLNEWDLGVLEGLRKDEAARQHAEDWATFSQHWAAPAVPEEVAARVIEGGESMLDVRQRAVACLEEACRQATDAGRSTVVVVTHGGVLGQLLKHAVVQRAAGDVPSTATPANACISTFAMQPGGCWRIVAWAEVDHLTGEATPLAANYNAHPVAAVPITVGGEER